MSFAELFLISVGLAMDAFAAALSDGLCIKKGRTAVFIAAMFGLFQAVMPIIGYALGSGFAGIIAAWDHFIALVVLGVIGGKMVIESISELRRGKADSAAPSFMITVPAIFAQAAATSIDALIVGVSFAAIGTRIVPAAAVIGSVTFALCLAGALGGKKFGTLLGVKAQLAGGIVLIAIGVKTTIEHLIMG